MTAGNVYLKHNDGWMHFTGPHCVIATDQIAEVRTSLAEVEKLVTEKGWYAAGWISYGAAPAFDPAMSQNAAQGFPLLWYGLYDPPEILPPTGLPGPAHPASLEKLAWTSNVEYGEYQNAIHTIKEYIAAGKTYQVNYTLRLRTDFSGDPWSLFLQLTQSQNKYAAFVESEDWAICSASHELFFELDGETITGRPMKGTVGRRRTTAEDREQALWLRNSIKNRAENLMIVDMIRNDLGRIAEIGSVHVPELFTIEKYPTLFQMTSTVQARTKASFTEIFSALFPCASITGAPKISTMKIIAELETSPRQIYTGCIGYLAPGRKAKFNVAIRTVLIDKKSQRAEYGVGGGIVWDSTSADEYAEALLKARVLTDPPRPQDFSLFETLLLTPTEGYFLLEKHVARMADSAEYFGFPFSKTALLETLQHLASGALTPKRVKILLDRAGTLSGESVDFHPQDKVFRVCLAKHAVDSQDRFLFHKTTRRDVYLQAGVSGYDDVLLFNENDELTEFTIGNLVVEWQGELFTPPVACGLLAGTLRAHLIETGEIKERILRKDELAGYSKIFLINSLRKWVNLALHALG